MKAPYDLIMGLCTYESVSQTITLIESANKIRGRILFMVTTVLPEDTRKLKTYITERDNAHDVILHETKINSRYFAQNWGFVYCFVNNIHSSFFGTMDDDTEFIGDGDLIEQLYYADKVGFAIMAFTSSSHHYASYGGRDIGFGNIGLGDVGSYKTLLFADGHNIFTHYNDNAIYGLCDAIGEGNIAYQETDYAARMRYFTGKPVIAQQDREFIRHTFRSDPVLHAIRTPFDTRNMINGTEFYKQKYGITIGPNEKWLSWEDVDKAIVAAPDETKLKMLVFGGMTPDWRKIHQKYESDFTLITSKLNGRITL